MQVYFSLSIDLSKTHTFFLYVGYQVLYFNEYVGASTFRADSFILYTQKDCRVMWYLNT